MTLSVWLCVRASIQFKNLFYFTSHLQMFDFSSGFSLFRLVCIVSNIRDRPFEHLFYSLLFVFFFFSFRSFIQRSIFHSIINGRWCRTLKRTSFLPFRVIQPNAIVYASWTRSYKMRHGWCSSKWMKSKNKI